MATDTANQDVFLIWHCGFLVDFFLLMMLIAMLVIGQGQVRLSVGTTYVRSDGDSYVQSYSCSLVSV